jgi:hypothetical protein
MTLDPIVQIGLLIIIRGRVDILGTSFYTFLSLDIWAVKGLKIYEYFKARVNFILKIFLVIYLV